MKKFAFLLLGAAFAANSCMGDFSPEELALSTVKLTVNIANPYTKAQVVEGDDMTLKNYQILVFSDDGRLDNSTTLLTGSERQYTLEITPGSKKIWVLGNIASAFADISESALRNTMTSLGDNSFDQFVMSGYKEDSVTSDKSLSLSLEHVASKIVIERIDRDFTNKEYSGLNLKIKRIYMSNVAGNASFDCSADPTVWYNKLGVSEANQPQAVSALISEDIAEYDLAEGASYSGTHTFYVYPNPETTNRRTGVWAPRPTRLVIECEYNGNPCYYPITIPKTDGDKVDRLERNTVYRISRLTLTRPGDKDPETASGEVSSQVSASFNITVANWSGGSSYTETFK